MTFPAGDWEEVQRSAIDAWAKAHELAAHDGKSVSGWVLDPNPARDRDWAGTAPAPDQDSAAALSAAHRMALAVVAVVVLVVWLVSVQVRLSAAYATLIGVLVALILASALLGMLLAAWLTPSAAGNGYGGAGVEFGGDGRQVGD
jgi:hypothetical protein